MSKNELNQDCINLITAYHATDYRTLGRLMAINRAFFLSAAAFLYRIPCQSPHTLLIEPRVSASKASQLRLQYLILACSGFMVTHNHKLLAANSNNPSDSADLLPNQHLATLPNNSWAHPADWIEAPWRDPVDPMSVTINYYDLIDSVYFESVDLRRLGLVSDAARFDCQLFHAEKLTVLYFTLADFPKLRGVAHRFSRLERMILIKPFSLESSKKGMTINSEMVNNSFGTKHSLSFSSPLSPISESGRKRKKRQRNESQSPLYSTSPSFTSTASFSATLHRDNLEDGKEVFQFVRAHRESFPNQLITLELGEYNKSELPPLFVAGLDFNMMGVISKNGYAVAALREVKISGGANSQVLLMTHPRLQTMVIEEATDQALAQLTEPVPLYLAPLKVVQLNGPAEAFSTVIDNVIATCRRSLEQLYYATSYSNGLTGYQEHFIIGSDRWSFPKLSKLRLAYPFLDLGPFLGCPNLTTLELMSAPYANSLAHWPDTWVGHWSAPKQLESLSLLGTVAAMLDPMSIRDMKQLNFLSIRYHAPDLESSSPDPILNESLVEMKDWYLPRLQSVVLVGIAMVRFQWGFLFACPILKYLHLQGQPASDFRPPAVLDLEPLANPENMGLGSLQGRYPLLLSLRLQSLVTTKGPEMTLERALDHREKFWPNLQELTLLQLYEDTDEVIKLALAQPRMEIVKAIRSYTEYESEAVRSDQQSFTESSQEPQTATVPDTYEGMLQTLNVERMEKDLYMCDRRRLPFPVFHNSYDSQDYRTVPCHNDSLSRENSVDAAESGAKKQAMASVCPLASSETTIPTSTAMHDG